MKEKKVLLVDDDHDVMSVLSLLFERSGAKVSSVSRGMLAMEEYLNLTLNGGSFDLLVFDIQMPEINGNQLVKAVREMGYKGKAVALTAYATEEGRLESTQSGFDLYFAKERVNRSVVNSLVN